MDVCIRSNRKAVWLVVIAAVILSGCSAPRILGVDFDDYDPNTVDGDFAGDIPGLPDGDFVEGHGFINGSLSIRVDGPAGGGDNLRVLDVSPPGIFRPALISFAVSEHEAANEYRVVWEGATEGPLHHTDVLFLDATGKEAIRLTFTDQSGGSEQAILLQTGGQAPQPITVVPDTVHEVLVVIRPKANEIEVRYESSGVVKTRSGLQLRESGFSRLAFVRFAGLNPSSAYYVSHLNALAKN